MGSISGCGSVPGAQSSGDNSPGGDNDPDLLPATVVEDEDPGEYVIVASKTDIGENAFVFSVESKRGVVDEWTWEWDFGDGEARAGTDQVYSFTEPGSYLVQATAYDIRGRVAVVLTLELNVEETNAQPTANAGENQTVDAGALVFLYGGASFDPDDESLTYEWAQTSGVPVNLLDAHAVTASFVAPRLDEDIVLEFSLTVGDGELTSQDFITVFVEGMIDIASTGPVADAGSDQVVLEGTTVTLNGSGSSAFGDTPLTFEWTQFAGPPVALNGRTEAVATFVAPSAFGGRWN
jgi:PKD repeat protein